MTVRKERPPQGMKWQAKYVRQHLVWAGDPFTLTVTVAVSEAGRRAGLSENMLSPARFVCGVPQLEEELGGDRDVTAEAMS